MLDVNGEIKKEHLFTKTGLCGRCWNVGNPNHIGECFIIAFTSALVT